MWQRERPYSPLAYCYWYILATQIYIVNIFCYQRHTNTEHTIDEQKNTSPLLFGSIDRIKIWIIAKMQPKKKHNFSNETKINWLWIVCLPVILFTINRKWIHGRFQIMIGIVNEIVTFLNHFYTRFIFLFRKNSTSKWCKFKWQYFLFLLIEVHSFQSIELQTQNNFYQNVICLEWVQIWHEKICYIFVCSECV